MQIPNIDASAEIKALGITHPVTFEAGVLNGPLEAMFGVAVANSVRNGLTEAQTIPPGDVVKVDMDAVEYIAAHPDEFTDNDSLNESIAHEIVHVRQMQDIGYPDADAVDRAYAEASAEAPHTDDPYDTYFGNKYEAEAFKLAPKYADLVKIGD